MAVLDRRAIRNIKEFIENSRRAYPSYNDFVISQILSNWILGQIVGRDWVKTHILTTETQENFLRPRSNNEYDFHLRATRINQLAEMVLNLNSYTGFQSVLDKLRTDDIESTFTELEVGRLLFQNGSKFEFLSSVGIVGKQPDLVIHDKDGPIFGETKCKFETTLDSLNTIKNALNYARKQLKPDHPNFIFLKVPQSWHNNEHVDHIKVVDFKNIIVASQDLFRGSKRVVAVVPFYSVVAMHENGRLSSIFATVLQNPSHRFAPRLFDDIVAPTNTPSGHWLDLSRMVTDKRYYGE